MVDNPFELLTKSQRAALGLASEAWTRLYDVTVTGVTQPEEAQRQVGALCDRLEAKATRRRACWEWPDRCVTSPR